MRFLQRCPAPPLDTSIAAIWLFEAEPQPLSLQRVLPVGAPQLIVNLAEDRTRTYPDGRIDSCVTEPGAILSGLRTRFEVIDSAEQEHVLGVIFHPGGTIPFFRTAASELSDAGIPLEALWGRARTSLLREQLLSAPSAEAKLEVMERTLASAWNPRAVHPAVAFGVETFRRGAHIESVGRVAAAAGLTTRRFADRFKADVGLTPKRYCRILRFQRAVGLVHAAQDVDWCDVALACGYFDQAHFIHDFRAFAGITPTGYLTGRTAFQNHVAFLQSAEPPPARQ